MSKMHKKICAVALGCAVMGAASWAFAQDVDGKLAAYRAASAEVSAVLARITDGPSAKLNQASLEAALKKQRDAENALSGEMGKIKPNDQASGQKMEAAMGDVAQTNEAISKEKMRVLNNKEAGDMVGKSLRGGSAPSVTK